MSHTPGPWHISNGVQIRSTKHQIAKVWMMRNGEGNDNARLIAAAPDLLEALKEIADHHESQRELWSSEENADADQAEYHEDRRNFALASIAKATGGDV